MAMRLSEVITQLWPGEEFNLSGDGYDLAAAYAGLEWLSLTTPKPSLAEIIQRAPEAEQLRDAAALQESKLTEFLYADGAENLLRGLRILAVGLRDTIAATRGTSTVWTAGASRFTPVGLNAMITRIDQILNRTQ